MTYQIQNINIEISSLLAFASDKLNLSERLTLQGYAQNISKENKEIINQKLEEINNRLVMPALEESTPTHIAAGGLNLSRVPEKLIAFIEQHQATIESISLRNNLLTTIPEKILELPKLQKLFLESNKLSTDSCDEIAEQCKGKAVTLTGQNMEIETPARQYTPQRNRMTVEQPFGQGVNPQTHKLQTKNESHFCAIM